MTERDRDLQGATRQTNNGESSDQQYQGGYFNEQEKSAYWSTLEEQFKYRRWGAGGQRTVRTE